jgi:hypothetical protein
MKAALFCLALVTVVGTPTTIAAEDVELRDLDVTRLDCPEGTARSEEGMERNRMKNRWPVDLSTFTVESLNTAAFLEKVRECDSRIRSEHRSQLTAAQKDQLDSYENQIVSLTGWLALAYAGPPETTNCASAIFHDWHLEIFERPNDHAPRIGDQTPIICEITPRTERLLYRDNVRIQSLTEFFRLQDTSYQATGHKAQKVRVTGYLLWDDEHNASADVGSTIQYIGSNGYHHPWRSTAWEIHPVMKIEAIQ